MAVCGVNINCNSKCNFAMDCHIVSYWEYSTAISNYGILSHVHAAMMIRLISSLSKYNNDR